MNYQFEFDPQNKILLLRCEGRLSDDLIPDLYWLVRQHSISTDARAGIFDLSAVTEFKVSPEMIFSLAHREPAMPNAAERPRVIVAPPGLGLGVTRMIELATSDRSPLLKFVLSRNQALAALGVQSPHFEPLDGPSADVSRT